LGRLQDAGDLAVRGSEKAGDLFGQRLIRRQPGELALPQVEIAPGKSIEVGCIVVFGGHGSL
jgi:hypothetical protein